MNMFILCSSDSAGARRSGNGGTRKEVERGLNVYRFAPDKNATSNRDAARGRPTARPAPEPLLTRPDARSILSARSTPPQTRSGLPSGHDLRAEAEDVIATPRRRVAAPDRSFVMAVCVAIAAIVGWEYFAPDSAAPGATAARIDDQPISGIVEIALDAPVMSTLDVSFAAPDVDATAALAAAAPAVLSLDPRPEPQAGLAATQDVLGRAPALQQSIQVALADLDGLGTEPQVSLPQIVPGIAHSAITPGLSVPADTGTEVAMLTNFDPLAAPDLQDAVPPLDEITAWLIGHVVAAPPTTVPEFSVPRTASAAAALDAPPEGIGDLAGVRAAAASPALPPLDLSGILVRVHTPGAVDPEIMALLALDLAGTGAELVDPVPFGYSVSSPHVRYYHADTADKAVALADFLGFGVRGFTDMASKPRAGTVEIWFDGVGAAAVAAAQPRASTVMSFRQTETAVAAAQRPRQPIAADRIDRTDAAEQRRRPWWWIFGSEAAATASSGGSNTAPGKSGTRGNSGGSNAGGNGNGNGNGGGGNGNGNGNNH